MQVLGQRIRDARKAKGWSQERLAFEAGIDRSYCGGLERGERNPSFNLLCALAKVLGSDLGEICRGLPLAQG